MTLRRLIKFCVIGYLGLLVVYVLRTIVSLVLRLNGIPTPVWLLYDVPFSRYLLFPYLYLSISEPVAFIFLILIGLLARRYDFEELTPEDPQNKTTGKP
jgi:hypothetical protein